MTRREEEAVGRRGAVKVEGSGEVGKYRGLVGEGRGVGL